MLSDGFDLKFVSEMGIKFKSLDEWYGAFRYCITRRILLSYFSLRVCTSTRNNIGGMLYSVQYRGIIGLVVCEMYIDCVGTLQMRIII